MFLVQIQPALKMSHRSADTNQVNTPAQQDRKAKRRAKKVAWRKHQRARQQQDLLLVSPAQASQMLCHPARELLPRVVSNITPACIYPCEQKLLAITADLEVACQYEPFLFQMYDTDFGARLATAPDLWFADIGLIVEIGCISSKSRRIRKLRENFPRLRFGLLEPGDVEIMPDSTAACREAFEMWLMETVSENDLRLESLDAHQISANAYKRAMIGGASHLAAVATAQKTVLNL